MSGAGLRLLSIDPAAAEGAAEDVLGDGEASSRFWARSSPKGRSGEPAVEGAGDETETDSGEAEAALQESGRRDGENTGELGMATEQDMARASSALGDGRGLRCGSYASSLFLDL